jgi:glutamate dehydrogenase
MVSVRASEIKRDRLEKVNTLVANRIQEADQGDIQAFIAQYYARVAPEDVADVSPENLYGAALSSWKFIANRQAKTPKIRVFTPKVEEHGWKTSHTVVEIITDDMPFIFDSVTGALNHAGHQTHLAIHPVIELERDENGNCTAFNNSASNLSWGKSEQSESFLHLEINELTDKAKLNEIEELIISVLGDVTLTVNDWRPMLHAVDELVDELQGVELAGQEEEVSEVVEFLKWVRDDHFTLMGIRDYHYVKRQGQDELEIVEDSGLGILRDSSRTILAGSHDTAADIAPIVRQFLERSELTLITKTGNRSLVHRQVHMDYLAIKRFDKKNRPVGERRFIGLFTSSAYNRRVRDIPIIRRKIAAVVERQGLNMRGHDGKAMMHILETYPRDEIFQVDVTQLSDFVVSILAIQDRPVIRMFARKDPFERFYSCIIYVPRERHSTELRRNFENILVTAMNGRISNYYTQVTDNVLARVHIIVGINKAESQPPVDFEAIEAKLIEAARLWRDDLYDALVDKYGEERGHRLAEKYCQSFSTAYEEQFSAEFALGDIEQVEGLSGGGDIGLNFYRIIEDAQHVVRLKLLHRGTAISLSDCLPMLENMGLKVIGESPFVIRPEGAEAVWLHDFLTEDPSGTALDLADLKSKLENVLEMVWQGAVEDDGFNRLVARAGLAWREVVIIRAYGKYLRQAAIAYSQSYMEDTLAQHPNITRKLIDLFHARFDPTFKGKREVQKQKLLNQIDERLTDVTSLDEDRILRRFLNLVTSTVRTNFYQAADDGGSKAYISLKLDSALIEELPLPRPFREIFVYSPRVEGVHLRGGRVARGGLRWSDRREDFRTEVLGLMKAQMVKNAVIVPVGSKGGFVPKHLPAPSDRDAFMAEGIACYQTFIRGLLDITDNLVGQDAVRPAGVLAHDDEDPYLVVAADKGTATFSDIANEIAIEYGFWLGDAFASGGAKGYDHKKMAITARGAWESVKRHFREIGHDTQSQDFDVIGIGDMSGDVFGNGMLLSKHIRLRAAFDHRDIFVDPDPDPAKSWDERKRLFDLPRSSWVDYDQKLISKGGGIFSRSLKSIPLSEEMQTMAGLKQDEATPMEYMQALLKAEVDLLWIGGIGTYVKGSHESQGDAGDRANDGLRINGEDLRAKVVGEGGNLGMTQLGRIEYALKGGRLNTDATDNSAGVDCSDHEVNIKILIDAIVADGEMTSKQRDRLLESMTDEVGELVLRDNYLQTQAMTMMHRRGAGLLEGQARVMRFLERTGRLDRAIEFLPDEEALSDRRTSGQGLTRPELSVLMAYAKMELYDRLLNSDITKSEALLTDLVKYFPRPLRRQHRDAIVAHRLRAEIIATITANSLVNRLGATMTYEVITQSGESVGEVARAYTSAREVFALKPIWNALEELDNKVPAELQSEITERTAELAAASTLWFLRNLPGPRSISKIIAVYQPAVEALAAKIDKLLGPADARAFKAKTKFYRSKGVPETLAKKIAALDPLGSACDIVLAANESGEAVEDVAQVYFSLGAELGLDWLRSQAESIETDDHWERSAVGAVQVDLFAHQRILTSLVLANGTADKKPKRKQSGLVETWLGQHGAAVDRHRRLIEDLQSAGMIDVSKLSYAAHQVGRLTQY